MGVAEKVPDSIPSEKALSASDLESGSTSSTDVSLKDAKARAAYDANGGRHVFEDDEFGQFYQPIDEFEGKHRFDPHAKWTPEQEAALVKRVSSEFLSRILNC